MGNSVYQPSFAGGELSPAAYGRIDLARYSIAVKTLRNMICRPTGGAMNRPGTRFQIQALGKCRLIPFEFSTVQNYILCFSDQKLRIVKDGGAVLEASQAITGVTQANPGVLTYSGADPVNGDWMYLTGIVGMTQLNGRFVKVANVNAGANTFELQTEDGVNINTTAYGAYTSGGTMARVYTVATPFLEADLFDLRFTQNADALTIVHPAYAPRQLTRTGHAAWTLSLFDYQLGPFQTTNTDTAKTVYASAATGAGITVTASAAIFAAANVGQFFLITQKNDGQPWEAGVAVALNDIRRANGKYYQATNAATTGTLRPSHEADDASDGAVTWRFLHPGFGVVKITAIGGGGTTATCDVLARVPDAAVGAGGATYKYAFGAWAGDQGYPAAVTYHQQRQVFGGTTAAPDTLWTSAIGAFTDFSKSQPVVDDDGLTVKLASRQVNAIRHLVSVKNLLTFTSGAEWVADTSGGFTSQTRFEAESYIGASARPPLVINNRALYVQAKGGIVRDMAFEFATDSYGGADLTVVATHLFTGYSLSDWAYQQIPFSCVWAVRSDGALLGLTYLAQEEVKGWHRHDTAGSFESVAVVAEGNEDAVYVVVKRTIGGVVKRFVERFASRIFTDVKDAYFVDAGLSYDGRHTAATTTMTVSGGTTWAFTETLTLTASVATFAATDVGKDIQIPDPTLDANGNVSGAIMRFRITAYTSATVVSVTANRTVPVALRNTATTNWTLAAAILAGLWHLEGQTVAILADGSDVGTQTVTNGAVTLTTPAGVVHVGLAYTSDLETLDLSLAGGETVRDKKKLIAAVRVLVEQSVGLKAGPDASHLREYAQRAVEHYDQPTQPLTGLAELRIPCEWSKGGRVLLRQAAPLPLHVLAAIPEVVLGGA